MSIMKLPAVADKYLPFWTPGTKARCIKDNPIMNGFGRALKVGDVVEVQGVCWRGKYELSVPAECAFYEMEGYFEPVDSPYDDPAFIAVNAVHEKEEALPRSDALVTRETPDCMAPSRAGVGACAGYRDLLRRFEDLQNCSIQRADVQDLSDHISADNDGRVWGDDPTDRDPLQNIAGYIGWLEARLDSPEGTLDRTQSNLGRVVKQLAEAEDMVTYWQEQASSAAKRQADAERERDEVLLAHRDVTLELSKVKAECRGMKRAESGGRRAPGEEMTSPTPPIPQHWKSGRMAACRARRQGERNDFVNLLEYFEQTERDLLAARQEIAELRKRIVAMQKDHAQEVKALEREVRDAARDAAAEAGWRERQGDDYGTW